MPPIRRKSRADKRRKHVDTPHPDRRSKVIPELLVKTEIKENNLLMWVKNPIIANNCYPLRVSIEKSLESTPVKRVIINMENVPYTDTAGVSLLVKLHRQFEKDNIHLILYRVTPRVKNIIEIMNLAGLLDMRNH